MSVPNDEMTYYLRCDFWIGHAATRQGLQLGVKPGEPVFVLRDFIVERLAAIDRGLGIEMWINSGLFYRLRRGGFSPTKDPHPARIGGSESSEPS